MRSNAQVDQLFTCNSTPQLFQLATLDNSDRAIVSCYLNARAGKQRCLAFLNAKAAHIRESLKGVDRLDFDSAIEIVRRTLDEVLQDDSQGIALFSRGALSGRHLTLVQTATPPDNRLVYSRSAEILPLMALQQCEPAGKVLLLQKGRFELLATGPNASTAPMCAGTISPIAGHTDSQGGAEATATMPEAWRCEMSGQQALREALASSRDPLLLVSDPDSLVVLSDWLPSEATEQLVGCIPLTPDADRRSVMQDARNRLTAIYQAEAKRLAQAITAGQDNGSTATGFRSVLQTLRNDAADTVVVSDWDQFGHGLPWEAKVEICFEALRRQCRIVLCDSLPLREAGGVGCLLRRDGELSVQRADAIPGHLQQVA